MTRSTSSSDDARSERSPHAEIAARLIDHRSAVGRPAVSPDGRHVAFVVATTSLDDNTTRSKVWLDDAPISGGEYDANPTWSPDGRLLAFTSRRGEKKGDSTLHVLPIGMPGETRTLCTMPDGLGDLSWSPDGRWIAFTSRTRDARYDAEDESWQAPRKIERLLSRLNGEGWIFDRPNHVHVVAADGTGDPRNLTPGEFQHAGTSWLADSSAVITSASRRPDWDDDFATDLYAVPLDEDAEIRCLTAGDGQRDHPVVSPDGTRVAFIGFNDMRAMSQNAKIGVIPTDAEELTGDRITWITLGLDRTFECINGSQAPVWVDDATLLATAEDRGEQHLYRLTADGSTDPEPITSGPRTIANYDAAGGTVATTQTTIEHPPELFVDGVRRTHVTAHTAAATRGWERFTVPTSDGTDEIDAWIMRPVDCDDSATYPVLLNVHGGPFTQYGEYFFDEAQMQAAAGFVVVLGNPRGGSGRDQEWGWSILGPKHPVAPRNGWGTVDVDDVLAIVDGALDRYPFCDPDRVGMLGGSYGGWMATWLAGRHGDRFRAVCSERAVNNLVAEEWSSDIATMFKMEHGVTHVEDEEEYVARSPVRFVDDIDTPMLIIHSEEDWRCPIGQAEELWIALKLRGKDVDFYRFPGENHDLSRTGSPVHRMQRAEIILDWFTDKLAPS